MRSHAQPQFNAGRRSASQPPGRRASARVDQDDLYGVLEVSREATTEEIRRAYKKMALKWHPDKNTDSLEHAAEMFKKVSHSYEILSKPETRQLYDMGGMAAVNGEVPVTPQTSHAAPEFRDADFNFDRHFRPHDFGGGGGFDRHPRHQHRSHPFMFHDPFEIFRQFFEAEEGYMGHVGEDDGFARGRRGPGGSFGRPRGSFFGDDFGFGMMGFGGRHPRGFGGGLFGGGSLHDAFFGGFPMGFSDSTGGTTMMMSSEFGGGLGGQSQSVSSSTVIQNGQRVTRTVTRTVDRDGNVHEDIDESVQQLPPPGAPTRGTPRLSGATGSGRIGRLPPR